jgi:hypothetical protein
MPIIRTIETSRPTQQEFGQIAYDLMRCVYDIHNEFDRFFDEAVYKRELADRMPGLELKLPVTVSRATFSKIYRLIHDWGSGLETALYEEALTHFLGGEERVLLPLPVMEAKRHLHDQKMRLLAPDVAFKITAFPDRLEAFEIHARRLLQHTPLRSFIGPNITHNNISFATIRQKDGQ